MTPASRNAPTWLSEFRSDTYSQTGEDGVIGKILDVLPEDEKWCVEFGASDGIYFSNSRNLIQNRGFSAVLIEADKSKFEKLQVLYAAQPQVSTRHAMVGFSATDNLDHLLLTTPIPREFSVLSIDIDGNDYHVWQAISKYSPRVVCIEFNPTIPTEVSFAQPPDPAIVQGSSLTALVDLGKRKGYELVSVLPLNAIFVRSDYYSLFGIENNTPAILRTDVSDVTYLFSGYDGTMFLRGSRMLPWHRLELKESRFQRLPRSLRRYPGRYGLLRKAAYALYILWTEPRAFVRKTRAKVRGGRWSNAGDELYLAERHRAQDHRRGRQ